MHLVQGPMSTTSSPRDPALAPADTVPDETLITEMAPSTEGNLKILNVIETNSEVMCCRFSLDGGLLAVGLASGIIKVYSPETGRCIYSLSDQDTLKSHLPVTCIRWKAVSEGEDYANVLLATYADGCVKHWHVTTSYCMSTIVEPLRQTLACSFNDSFSQFATAGSNTKIYLYDEKTKQLITTLEPSSSHLVMDGHMSRVFTVKYIPEEDHIFASAGWDDTVQFWDTRVDAKHSVRKIFGPHICGDALDILPSNRKILTGSWRKNNTLQIWDYNTGKLIKDVPGDEIYSSMVCIIHLYCVQWQGPDGVLTGGSDKNIMRYMDQSTLHTMGRIVDLPRAVYTVDYDRHPLHPTFAAGTDNYIYLSKKI
ncbi:hypothetical protein QZH41_008335 [Actinostola sp. cb2023]|nr:hypothetical protein QZH41_008335 [Actinostola sp. cb2023]